MTRPQREYSAELEASLLLVLNDIGLLHRCGDLFAPVPKEVWAQPQYEDAGECLWRILPGQGYWSGALLAPAEVELLRQGRVVIECRELVRSDERSAVNAAAPVDETGAETFN